MSHPHKAKLKSARILCKILHPLWLGWARDWDCSPVVHECILVLLSFLFNRSRVWGARDIEEKKQKKMIVWQIRINWGWLRANANYPSWTVSRILINHINNSFPVIQNVKATTKCWTKMQLRGKKKRERKTDPGISYLKCEKQEFVLLCNHHRIWIL